MSKVNACLSCAFFGAAFTHMFFGDWGKAAGSAFFGVAFAIMVRD